MEKKLYILLCVSLCSLAVKKFKANVPPLDLSPEGLEQVQNVPQPGTSRGPNYNIEGKVSTDNIESTNSVVSEKPSTIYRYSNSKDGQK